MICSVPRVLCVYCFVSRSPVFRCSFYSISRSVFIGWLDCQSSFWRHDVCQSAGVPAVFEDASWLCVCAPCQRTLCSNAVSSLCSTPIVYRCLMYLVLWVILCVVRCDLFIDLFLVHWLVSNSLWKITLMPVLEFQSYYVKFKAKNACWCIGLVYTLLD